mmetsp:Transcript_11727/g.31206  ORF Transcript_11727/g.31206 Transcript_11727/m.31206 type:complete len:244 (+) Transcript_11727:171-902(+)
MAPWLLRGMGQAGVLVRPRVDTCWVDGHNGGEAVLQPAQDHRAGHFFRAYLHLHDCAAAPRASPVVLHRVSLRAAAGARARVLPDRAAGRDGHAGHHLLRHGPPEAGRGPTRRARGRRGAREPEAGARPAGAERGQPRWGAQGRGRLGRGRRLQDRASASAPTWRGRRRRGQGHERRGRLSPRWCRPSHRAIPRRRGAFASLGGDVYGSGDPVGERAAAHGEVGCPWIRTCRSVGPLLAGRRS